MLLLAVLLMGAAAALVIDLAMENASVRITVSGHLFTLNPAWVLGAGLVVGVLALAGLVMFSRGVGRARHRRRAMASVAAERDRLAAELEELLQAQTSASPSPPDRTPVGVPQARQ